MSTKRKKTGISILAFFAIAIIVFICSLFKVIRVSRVNVSDSSVYDWLEEMVQREKDAPYFNNRMCIVISTTRNSIICTPLFRSEVVIDDTPSGCAEIDGMKLLILENKLEGGIPPVFETAGRKMNILLWSDFALSACRDIFNEALSHIDSYESRDQRYYKFIDGSWRGSTWEDTFGEEMKEEDGQWDAGRLDDPDTGCAVPPEFIEKYKSLTEANIRTFIGEWEQWSDQLRTHSKDSLINGIITRIYKDYRKDCAADSCAFHALEHSIEVRRYAGKLDDYPPLSVFPDEEDDLAMIIKASERYCYVPSAALDRKYLYMAPGIERLLSVYLSGEDDLKINPDRLAFLRKYVQIERGCEGGWHIGTMPVIFAIYLFDDGYVVDSRTSFCTGGMVFFPYDSNEKREIDVWME